MIWKEVDNITVSIEQGGKWMDSLMGGWMNGKDVHQRADGNAGPDQGERHRAPGPPY